MTAYTSEAIRKELDKLEVEQELTLVISKGDTAWNPASTKNAIYGPAIVKYVQYVDGGVRATIIEQ